MMDRVVRLPPWRFAGGMVSSLSPQERDWGLSQFRIPQAWKSSRGAGVRIAVLDTGVDGTHRDLRGQVLAMRDFSGSPHGAEDVQAHGTHCAGIIAAREDDQGMVGVCPDVAEGGGGLLVGKVLGDDGSGLGSWVAAGIEWAVAEGAQIVSMSLGSPYPDQRIHEAIVRATKAGAYVITAAGNDGGSEAAGDRVNYPARYGETIAVAAVGRDHVITEFSSRGEAVDIAAPGEEILSTVPGNRYVRLSGTSMATPFVAGVVALALSLQDLGSVQQLRQLLYRHADDAGPPGKDWCYGAGLIRPDTMVGAGSSSAACGSCSSSAGILVWIPGGQVQA